MNKTKITGLIILLGIILLAATVRSWGVTSLDIQSDHAINSFRALGWLDYLAGEGQTAPITWLGEIPWWGHLSFHDHPPLVFLFQHIFFNVFGETSLAAFFPFILAGILTAALLFFTLYKTHGVHAATAAALLYALSSYAVWASRTGYLEGVQVLFIAASIFFLIRYASTTKETNLLYWWAACGLAIISKYTAIFLIPAAGLYFLIWKRGVFKSKFFWIGVIAFFVVLSPVITYNVMTYQTRGHFDASLSAIFGMDSGDFSVIGGRSVSLNPVSGITAFITTIAKTSAPTSVALYAITILLLIINAFRRKLDESTKIIALHLAVLCVMLIGMGGGSDRFLSILIPFFALLTGITFSSLYSHATASRKKIIYGIGGALLIVELLYGINTNLMPNPIGPAAFFFSPYRTYATGFAELDAYMRKNVMTSLPARKKIDRFSPDVAELAFKDKDAIIIDERADWFQRMWYVRRYVFYYGYPYMFPSELSDSAKFYGDESVLVFLLRGGVRSIWLVEAVDIQDQSHNNTAYSEQMNELVGFVNLSGIEPATSIVGRNNKVAFRVYHFRINANEQAGE